MLFNISKTYQKEKSKRSQFLVFQNHVKIRAIISVFHLNCIKKYTEKTKSSRQKKHRNDMDILQIEVTPKKVRRNNVDFLLIQITLKKVCQNDIDFSPIEIKSKKYVEMT